MSVDDPHRCDHKAAYECRIRKFAGVRVIKLAAIDDLELATLVCHGKDAITRGDLEDFVYDSS